MALLTDEQLAALLTEPQRVMSDAGSTEMRPIKDALAAMEFAERRRAGVLLPLGGSRIQLAVMPGAVGSRE